MIDLNNAYNKATAFAREHGMLLDKGELVFDGLFMNGSAYFFRANPIYDKDGRIIMPPPTGFPTYIYFDGNNCRYMSASEITTLWKSRQ